MQLSKPTQIRIPQDLKEKIEKIAQKNHLSDADVIRICLAQTIPLIERDGITILPPDVAETAEAAA